MTEQEALAKAKFEFDAIAARLREQPLTAAEYTAKRRKLEFLYQGERDRIIRSAPKEYDK